jgi:PAS domain S-box-containing protein
LQRLIQNYPIQFVIVAMSYVIAGKVGLALAIEPGYASAIFPASGIAITSLLFWGPKHWISIFVGSLLLNTVATQTWVNIELKTMLLAASIALGSTIQAMLARWLLIRFVDYPRIFSNDKQVFYFLAFSGPVPCIVAATFGAFSLFMFGAIEFSQVAFTWLTWWVGDTLGIIVILPILLPVFSKPVSVWKPRMVTVSLPLCIFLVAVFTLFFRSSDIEQQRINSAFEKKMSHYTRNLEHNLERFLDNLYASKSFVESQRSINKESFRKFSVNILARNQGIHAVSWNPVVGHQERVEFERLAKQEIGEQFFIKQKSTDGNMIPALHKESYVVVKYIEPFEINKGASGFDVSSNSARNQALVDARVTGKPVGTKKISLVQESGSQSGLLVFLAVYADANDSKSKSKVQKRKELKGYIVGVFRIGDLLKQIFEPGDASRVAAKLTDISDDLDGPVLLAQYGAVDGVGDAFWRAKELKFSGRIWQLDLAPTFIALEESRSLSAWIVFVFGLLISALAGMFLLSISTRTSQVEALVNKRTAELKMSQSRTATIVNNAIDGVVTIDHLGLIESVNPAAEGIFGYSQQEMLSSEIGKFIPKLEDQVNANTAGAFKPELYGIVLGRAIEMTAVLSQEQSIPIEVALVSNNQIGKNGYIIFIKDITERKQVERLTSEFISTVNHELRTPLTSIIGSLGLVDNEVVGTIPDSAKSLIKVARRNSEKLNLLINDLLDMEKLAAGKMQFQLDVQLVYPMVIDVIDHNRGIGSARNIDIKCTSEPSDLKLIVDQHRFAQVLSNLLSNAVKYSKDNGSVEVSIDVINSYVRIAVQDYGSGIPVEFKDKIFQKFSQADSSDTRKIGGTGLGLAIAKSLVEGMGGRIDFISEANKGSVFFIEFKLESTV